jgi:hypothetical protein
MVQEPTNAQIAELLERIARIVQNYIRNHRIIDACRQNNDFRDRNL